MPTKPGTEAHNQKVRYIALRRAGWVVRPSQIAWGYWVAVKPEREESVSAKDFQTLHELAYAKDVAWRDKQRKASAS